jgi:pyruvate/2-oxoglutarate dehydrogenase complex dihydrolipoamide dehydrogenase (E3) component
MPSKALLYAAEVLHLARSAKTWGLRIPKAGFDFKAVMARKNAMIAEFRPGPPRKACRPENSSSCGPMRQFCRSAHGRVERCHGRRAAKSVKAKHFIVCTGSVISPATVPGLAEIGFLTSDDALSLRKLPRSLIVLGGGPVAVELAQFLAGSMSK